MRARRSAVDIVYEGVNISTTLAPYLQRFTFKEVAGGGSDSISLSIVDRQKKWISSWFPSNKDKISCGITVNDWAAQGDDRYLHCGTFTVDDVSASGSPLKLSVAAVSAPVDKGFTSTDKTVTWEAVTIQQIAERIASDAGLALVYDAGEIMISAIEQSNTDSSFLSELCQKYGLSLKIYAQKLIIFDRERYKQRAPIATITQADMASWSYNETLQGTYTGVKYAYTDAAGGEDIEYIYGTDERLLNANVKSDSLADAELQAIAKLNDANHNAITMSVTIMGNPSLVAGATVLISGIGRPDGKYYINEISHSVGGGYTTSLSLSKVQ